MDEVVPTPAAAPEVGGLSSRLLDGRVGGLSTADVDGLTGLAFRGDIVADADPILHPAPKELVARRLRRRGHALQGGPEALGMRELRPEPGAALRLAGGSDQEDARQNATEWVVEDRASRGKLASFGYLLEQPLRRACAPPTQRGPCASGAQISAPSRRATQNAKILVRIRARSSLFELSKPLRVWSLTRIGAKSIARRGGPDSWGPKAHGQSATDGVATARGF